MDTAGITMAKRQTIKPMDINRFMLYPPITILTRIFIHKDDPNWHILPDTEENSLAKFSDPVRNL
jgi:hypothetical protein